MQSIEYIRIHVVILIIILTLFHSLIEDILNGFFSLAQRYYVIEVGM